MKIMVAVDDDYGMLFNHRRISQDEKVRKKIMQLCQNTALWMNSYSASQFSSNLLDIQVAEDFLKKAKMEEYCFVEDQKLLPFQDDITEMVVFYWNRRYPSDFKLDLIPETQGYVCTHTEEFAGKSHKKITMEVWKNER